MAGGTERKCTTGGCRATQRCAVVTRVRVCVPMPDLLDFTALMPAFRQGASRQHCGRLSCGGAVSGRSGVDGRHLAGAVRVARHCTECPENTCLNLSTTAPATPPPPPKHSKGRRCNDHPMRATTSGISHRVRFRSRRRSAPPLVASESPLASLNGSGTLLFPSSSSSSAGRVTVGGRYALSQPLVVSGYAVNLVGEGARPALASRDAYTCTHAHSMRTLAQTNAPQRNNPRK
jgi:hypothetical protein